MIILSSSSFFLPDYLTEKLQEGEYSQNQFKYALEKEYSDALLIEAQSHTTGSKHWLSIHKKLAQYQQQAAFKLGRWYKHEAIHSDTNLTSENSYQAVMWLEQSIALGNKQAALALAQLYYYFKAFDLAEKTINSLSHLSKERSSAEAILVIKLKLAIYYGEIKKIESLVSMIEKVDSKELKALLLDIVDYGILEAEFFSKDILADEVFSQVIQSINDRKLIDDFSLAPKCATSLQLFATNIEQLKYTESLIDNLVDKQEVAKFVCFAKPRYISKQAIACETSPNKPIQCNESQWQELTTKVTTRHIGLMLEEGGANVHFGMLYLNQNDNVHVFSHEISHLLGFVDEYPLPESHKICQRAQQNTFSHNIAVLASDYYGNRQEVRAEILKRIPWAEEIADTIPLLTHVGRVNNIDRWRLGSPQSDKVGVYVSETCNNTKGITDTPNRSKVSYLAFKPLNSRTQLRYNQSEFPQAYSVMLAKRPLKFLMPSYHYNIALSEFRQGNIHKAKTWLTYSAQFEQDPVRKSMILQGSF